MTATLDNVLYDDLGAEITPGTVCWVQTDSTVPALVRNGRCLAVYCRGAHLGSSQQWLLLIPVGEDEDPWARASETGWPLNHHLTYELRVELNVDRFADTHRGWWPGTGATFIETTVGHWCTEHKVFHATEECPPPTTAQFTTVTSMVTDLRAELAAVQRELVQARADVEQARIQGEQNLQDFKVKCSDILGEEAREHDLCGVYDEVAERAGLYPRMADQDVEIEVTHRMTITVKARNWEAAAEIIRDKMHTNYYEPMSPFADESDIEIGSAYSLEVNVVD